MLFFPYFIFSYSFISSIMHLFIYSQLCHFLSPIVRAHPGMVHLLRNRFHVTCALLCGIRSKVTVTNVLQVKYQTLVNRLRIFTNEIYCLCDAHSFVNCILMFYLFIYIKTFEKLKNNVCFLKGIVDREIQLQ